VTRPMDARGPVMPGERVTAVLLLPLTERDP
jgi:hypothetical protein